MVVPEAARPPAESLDSPYAASLSKKGKNASVSSIASMKLLMRGVSPRDIFSRAPSRAPSEKIGLARTSGAQGSGSSALETIEKGASESDAETTIRDVDKPGHSRTDSAVVRGLVGDAIGKVTGTESGAVVVPVAPLTKSEEKRAKSIEALLAKRDAGEAPSADEPSSAELRKELVGLEARRAAASASVTGATAGAGVAPLTKLEEERAKSIEALLAKRDAGEAPSADEPSSAELRKELVGLEARRAVASASVSGGSSAAAPGSVRAPPSPAASAVSEAVSGAPSVASVELDLPRATSRAGAGGPGPRRVSASVAASPYGSALRSKSKMRRAIGQVASASAATRAMKPVKKKGKENESGHARTDSAVIHGLVLDAITTITEHDPETATRGLVRDAIDKAVASETNGAAETGSGDASSVAGVVSSSAGHARTDSAVIRGLVGDAIEKVEKAEASGAGSGASSASAITALSSGEAARLAALESILARRDGIGGDDAEEDDEPLSTEALRAELETLRSRATGAASSITHSPDGGSTRSLRGAHSASDPALAPATSAKSRFRRAISAVSMGSLFARAPPRAATPRGLEDPRVFANDGVGSDPVRSLVQGALRAATEKEADTDLSSFGAYGALSVEEEAREKTLFSALALLDAKENANENANENETNEGSAFSLQAELVVLEAKRVKAAAASRVGGHSAGANSKTAELARTLALTPQEEDRAAFLERVLAKRQTEGGVPAGARPSSDLRRELIALLARRAAAEQAEDERADFLEAMLADEGKKATKKKESGDDAGDDAQKRAARSELESLREKRAARLKRAAEAPGTDTQTTFDLVVTSPVVPGAPLTPKPPRGVSASANASPRRVAASSGRAPKAQPRAGAFSSSAAPASMQRSQFGPMVDSLKRSSPSVGFGSALRFDFQRASAPPPDSERGQTLRRSQSRLRRRAAEDGDLAFSLFSVPGPGTYATTKYRAFGPQTDGEKKSFPAISMGRAGRFAAAERETKTTRRWPGPDAYEAIGSLGAQPVSRRDTLPRIAFTRARRAVGNVSRRGSEDEEDVYHHGDNAVGPGSYANASGMGRQAVSGRITAPARRFPKDGRWGDGGGGGGGAYGAASSGRLYDSVGDQALSYHPNAPYVHFGTSFRERAGLVSLSKKQAKKAMCGKLGPGPAYPAGPSAVGKQVHSGKATAPAIGFTRDARLDDARFDDAAEEPGPGSYRV